MTSLASLYDHFTEDDWSIMAKGWHSTTNTHVDRAVLPFIAVDAMIGALSARNAKFHFGNSRLLRRLEHLRKKLKRTDQQGQLRHNCQCAVCTNRSQDTWPRPRGRRIPMSPNFQQLPSRLHGRKATTLIIDDIVKGFDGISKSIDECVLSYKHFQEALQYLRKNDAIRTCVSV